ncbi:hypothetical protein SLE2022_232890 [Rubroshorea leprosula]
MIDKCLGPQRSRKIQRALCHLKVTILCLVFTVVVLRGTIGAGKFGTPDQDFNEIYDHFKFCRRAEPHCVLEEVQTTSKAEEQAKSDTNADGNNYNAFDINKILIDEEDGDSKPSPNKPYSLGPKISDWDRQRAKWLKENLDYPNFIGPNKPRVLLVTRSSPKPCENRVGDHYLLKSIKNKIDYCMLHGIDFSLQIKAKMEVFLLPFLGLNGVHDKERGIKGDMMCEKSGIGTH